MIVNILAVAEPVARRVISLGGILAVLMYAFIFGLIIIGLLRLVRFLGSANKEMRLVRMEVGKLAEEVHLLRQRLEGEKEQDSSANSE